MVHNQSDFTPKNVKLYLLSKISDLTFPKDNTYLKSLMIQSLDKVDSPKVKSPKVKSPKVKSPKVKSPKVKSPKVNSPKVKSPKVKSPKVKSPKVKSPKVKSPKVKSPKVKSPRTIEESIRDVINKTNDILKARPRIKILDELPMKQKKSMKKSNK
jgi:hypothetical protein